MKKTVYEIREYNAQLTIKRIGDLAQLRPGCASGDTDPVLVASYDDEATARKHLDRLMGSVDIKDAYVSGKVAIVTEYGLECNGVTYDEDGDIDYVEPGWVDFGGFPTEIEYLGTVYEYNRLAGWMPVEDDEEAADDE